MCTLHVGMLQGSIPLNTLITRHASGCAQRVNADSGIAGMLGNLPIVGNLFNMATSMIGGVMGGQGGAGLGGMLGNIPVLNDMVDMVFGTGMGGSAAPSGTNQHGGM